MRKKNSRPHDDIEESQYQSYIDSLQAVVNKSEESKHKNIQELHHSTNIEEHRLHECLNSLEHLKRVKEIEQLEWDLRAQQLAFKQKELEIKAMQHSHKLAHSKAQLEHGLRMINLFPNSSANDYLKNTSSTKTINEALKNDWSRVGEQIALTLYELRKLQEK